MFRSLIQHKEGENNDSKIFLNQFLPLNFLHFNKRVMEGEVIKINHYPNLTWHTKQKGIGIFQGKIISYYKLITMFHLLSLKTFESGRIMVKKYFLYSFNCLTSLWVSLKFCGIYLHCSSRTLRCYPVPNTT